MLLKSIPDSLEKISQPDKSNTEKYKIEEAWAAKFNQPETWDAFYAVNPTWAHQIKRLHDLWNKQKEFTLCTNQQLLKALDDILLSLQCIEKARLEFGKYHRRLPDGFALRYGKYLNQLHHALLQAQSKIVYAMFARLKISYHYSQLALTKKPHIDDVIFYMTDHLNVLGLVDKTEVSLNPNATLDENAYLKFYDAVKRYGHSAEENHYADMFHWSNQIKIQVLLSSRKKSVSQNIDIADKGITLVTTDKTKIAVPSSLRKFMPPKRRTPAWFFWEENKILDFWEKRQGFLFKLHQLYPDRFNTKQAKSMLQLQYYQELIEIELQNIKNENLPLLAFTFKDMIKQWQSILENLYQCSLHQAKISTIEAGQQRLAEGLKSNLPKVATKNILPNRLKSQFETVKKENNAWRPLKKIPLKLAEKETIQPVESQYKANSFFN